MKRVYGVIELVFNICYLLTTLVIGIVILVTAGGRVVKVLAGCMALVLVAGDAFHLIPRVFAIKCGQDDKFRHALGVGKQIASITMTVFYVLLWHIALLLFDIKNDKIWTAILYALALARIIICLLPHNKWSERHSPTNWGIIRNIPFFMLGMGIAVVFFLYRENAGSLRFIWLAIAASFAFYMPVVIWSNKSAKIGMLMLPKAVSYISMLVMCLYL